MEDRQRVVYRQLAIPVPVFDRIKDMQRREEAQHGHRPSLMETVARIVREHQQTEEREARNHAASNQAQPSR